MNKPIHHHDSIRAIEWRDNSLYLLDQRHLPHEERYIEYSDCAAVAEAITDMVVRGAPAIGITAAFGAVLAARARYNDDRSNWQTLIKSDLDMLRAARPTAVNLAWAVDKMALIIATFTDDMDPVPTLLSVARGVHEDDIAACRFMGELGASLIAPDAGVLTHCNTGSLATGGYGTALGVIRAGVAAGRINAVYADETRPWLQGARLTAWELVKDGIPVTLIADGAAAALMSAGRVQWVIVGSDRIAANGDVANKIGTYSAAVNARHHGAKFMVVAPTSTIDLHTATGADIPIEERDTAEVLGCAGNPIAPSGAKAWNPAFDVTPAHLVDAIVTEKGVVEQPNEGKIAALMGIGRA